MAEPNSNEVPAGGAHLKAARIAAGYVVRARFAEAVGVIPGTVGRWEDKSQVPQRAQLDRIAEVLERPTSEVYAWFRVAPPAPPRQNNNVAYLDSGAGHARPTPRGVSATPPVEAPRSDDPLDPAERALIVGAMAAALQAGHVTEERWLTAAEALFKLTGAPWPAHRQPGHRSSPTATPNP